ncbi:ribosome recycling factor-domain-containing protein [Peziza echinospora]|nr:ribosome recycling factor-domain-containing protein [Peziza echinospora]
MIPRPLVARGGAIARGGLTKLRPTTTTTLLPTTHLRPFTSTPTALKKANKSPPPKTPLPHHTPPTPTTASTNPPFDYDDHFTSLTKQIQTLHQTLQTNLTKLRTTQSSSTATPLAQLEHLPVILDKTADPPTTAPLRDLAHITPKSGRSLLITLYESANAKRVISAIQKADLNMQPIQDPTNALVLTVPLPPPTKEGREKMGEMVVKTGEKARNELKLLRAASHKLIKGLKNERPDDVRKADQRLEKIVKAEDDEMKKVVEAVKKAVLEA